MSTYTQQQLDQYFEHIGFTPQPGDVSLACLASLQRHHLARVPFESVTLHYSKFRLLSIDPGDLFEKIVVNSRGGYCMEVNTLFAAVLRSLGFSLISAGAKVVTPNGITGWSHMVNLVRIQDRRYVVDVGFGSNVAPCPVPIEHGIEFDVISPARGKLEYKTVSGYSDPSQKLWVYSKRDNDEAPWTDQNCFIDHEFMPQDFGVMNLHTMTSPTSFFTQNLLAVRTILDESKEKTVGILILFRDYVKRQVGDKSEVLETLQTEEQRIEALKIHFKITLSTSEQRGIRGLGSELKRSGDS